MHSGGRLATVVVALLAPAAAAQAAVRPLEVRVRSTVSGPVLPAACSATGSESFPGIGADPGNPRRLTSVWLSDGVRGAAASVSTDAGRTWRRGPVPGATTCTGGPPERAELVNPRVAAGPAGRFWFGSSWISGDELPLFEFGIAVHPYDGSAWGAGVAPGTQVKAQNVAVVPHPGDPRRATAVAVQHTAVPVPPLIAYGVVGSRLVASSTTDGGRTWSPAVDAQPRRPERLAVEVRAVRRADGTIVAVFSSVPLTDLPKALTGEPVTFTLEAVSSSDEGRTWSAPVRVGEHPQFSVADPEGRAPAGSSGGNVAGVTKFDLAASPDGTVWAAWADQSGVRLARSASGSAWEAPRTALPRASQPFEVALAASGDGRVGVFFYDWSADVPGDAPLTTTPWLATSADSGGSWSVLALDEPFDLRATYVDGLPYDGGLSLGVTQSVAGLPRAFGVAYTVGPPLSAGPTDVRYAHVGPRPRTVRTSKAKRRRGAGAPRRGARAPRRPASRGA